MPGFEPAYRLDGEQKKIPAQTPRQTFIYARVTCCVALRQPRFTTIVARVHLIAVCRRAAQQCGRMHA